MKPFRSFLFITFLSTYVWGDSQYFHRTEKEAFTGTTERQQNVKTVLQCSFLCILSDCPGFNIEANSDGTYKCTVLKELDMVGYKIQENIARYGSPEKCTSGVPYDRLGKYCYKFVEDAITWYEARAHCQGIGGDLAYVDDPKAVKDHMVARGYDHKGGSWWWIGANNIGHKTVHRWLVDGSEVDSEPFIKNEPSNLVDNCVETKKEEAEGKYFADTGCTQERSFICQK